MSRYDGLQTAFVSGELAKSLRGRSDLKQYVNGVREARNFIPRIQGGLYYRGGFEYIATAADQAHAPRSYDFQPTLDAAYVITFYHNYIEIFKNGVKVTLTNPVDAAKPTQIPTTWTYDQLYSLGMTPSIDWLFIFHKTGTKKLTRVSVGATTEDWQLTDFTYQSGPYLPEDDTDTNMVLSSPSYILKLDSAGLFGSAVAGQYVEYPKDNSWKLGRVLSTSTTPAAPANPTANTIYIEPVTSRVVGLDDSAIYSYDSSTTEIRSSKQQFKTGLVGSYIRIMDSKASNATKWALISSYKGIKNYPTTTVTNPTKADITVGHTYKITAYTSGYITAVDGSTYQVKTLGESFTAGTGYTLSSPVMTLDDMSTLTQFDCLGVATPVTFVSISTPVTETIYKNEATLTASQATFDGTRDVGRSIRLILGNYHVPLKIKTVASSTSATVTVLDSLPYQSNSTQLMQNGATTVWRWGAFYTNNYPVAGAIHEQRLAVGGAPANTPAWYQSIQGKYDFFDPTDSEGKVLDTSSIQDSVSSSKSLSGVRWFFSAINFFIGTESCEVRLRTSTSNPALTPSNYRPTQDSANGSLYRPTQVNSALYFAQRSGTKFMEYAYDYYTDAFQADDTSIIAEHILKNHGGIKDFAFQQNPYSVMWVLLNDGLLGSLTLNKKQNVYAWATHPLAAGAKAESLCVVASSDGTRDDLYVDIILGTVRMKVRLAPEFIPQTPQDKASMAFLDFFKKYGAGVTTATGLDHLEGKTVKMVVDGGDAGSAVVTSGQVIFPKTSVAYAYVGMSYRGLIKPNPLPIPLPQGASMGTLQNTPHVRVYVVDSLGMKVGGDENSLKVVPFRKTTDNMDESTDLVTDVVRAEIATVTERDPEFVIVQDSPYPLNVLALAPETEVNTN